MDSREKLFFDSFREVVKAIENARMYEQLRKDYENLMNEILMFVGYRRSI